MEAEVQTVEVPEAEVKEESRPSMTVDEAKANGWGAKEIESGLKRKMLVAEPTPEEKAKQEAEAKAKAEGESAAKGKPEEKPEEKKEPAKDFSHSQQFKDFDLTPDQERELKAKFPYVNGKMDPVLAIYYRGKNERLARQRAVAEREEARKEAEALKARIAALESKKQPVLDEEGNEIDPDDKPLTMRDLREIEKKRIEEFNKKQSEQNEESARILRAQKDQEEFARGLYPDYKETTDLAKDVILRSEELFPERWKQEKVRALFERFQEMAESADKYALDDYNPALIAYEIGQMHPEYGKSTAKAEQTQDGKQPQVSPKANGGLTPEQVERMAKNAQRKPSSASIPGGNGKRTVVPEEVTKDDINRMNYEERARFKKNHPEAYRKAVYDA